MTYPGVVWVQSEAGVVHQRPQAVMAERTKSYQSKTEDLYEGERRTRAKISNLMTLCDLVPLLITPSIRTKVANMGGDDDDK